MRRILGLAAAAGVASLTFATSAEAITGYVAYPWCARYGGADYGGAENCGFSTFEQCLATVRGIGGHCQMNVNWPPANAEPRANRRKPPAR